MWIDIHAHLADLPAKELASLVSECTQAGITHVINTATSLASSDTVLMQHAAHPSLLPAVGISPFDTPDLPHDWERTLDMLLSRPEVVACGETGIDTSNPSYPPLSVQMPVFERHLALASKHNKPVIIHSRGCERDTADRCAAAGVTKAVFHCFTGNMTDLKSILDHGYYVSFSGIITFKSRPLDDVVAYTPNDRLFIETDSPYLAPVPHRGKQNRPSWVVLVGMDVANIKKMRGEVLAQRIRENFRVLFGIETDQAESILGR